MTPDRVETLRSRTAPIDMNAARFGCRAHLWWTRSPTGCTRCRRSGGAPGITGRRPARARRDAGSPTRAPTRALLDEAHRLLFRHSLFNGHPRFFGYITSSPAPIGALGDLLASAINQNVGAWRWRRWRPRIEAQTIRGLPT
jgi:hypothetical protein